MVIMEYEISAGAFFVGLGILIVGVLFMRFHTVVADNLANGVSSYDKFKLYALACCVLGVVVMVNLHATLLNWFFGLFFGS